MPNSKFESPATMDSDGRISVHGGQQVDPLSSASEVEYRFLLVQGDVAVKGTGVGHGTVWTGLTDPNQPRLQVGPVLAIGLAILARRAATPGFTTFSWSDQIDLVYG